MKNMRVISTLDCVEVYTNDIDVTVEKGSVKVYYKDGSIEIRPENKQIIIMNYINRKEIKYVYSTIKRRYTIYL